MTHHVCQGKRFCSGIASHLPYLVRRVLIFFIYYTALLDYVKLTLKLISVLLN